MMGSGFRVTEAETPYAKSLYPALLPKSINKAYLGSETHKLRLLWASRIPWDTRPQVL